MEETNIIIVEDHQIVRQALRMTLSRLSEKTICHEAQNAHEAIELLEKNPFCDLIMVDLMLPEIDGYQLLEIISEKFASIPAIVFSAVDTDEFVDKAMNAGASGFISKNASSEEIVASVQTVLDGGTVRPRIGKLNSVKQLVNQGKNASELAKEYKLTAAQTKVLEQLAKGLSNEDIANTLNLKNGTVRVHVSAIFKAMGVSNRSQAVLKLTKGGMKVS